MYQRSGDRSKSFDRETRSRKIVATEVWQHKTMAGVTARSDGGPENAQVDFATSMPEEYWKAFPNDATEHAAIAARRGDRSAHLELWRASNDGTSVVCVVADDRPGLLSTICRLFVAHELDVVSAQIYRRSRPDGLPSEAFDLFWLRPRRGRAARRLSDDLVAQLARKLEAAVTNSGQSTLPPGRVGPKSSFGSLPPPRVYFNTSSLRRGEYVLIVETLDCPGLLLCISLALHRQGVEIASSDVRTEDGIAHDSFVLADPSAKPLSSDRLAALRQAVIEAVRTRLLEVQSAG
jgi:UTP:GlnB (protein PII) uridylyltransferase